MAKTGHPNFDYTCQGQWRGAAHNFSITGNHSGTSFGQADAQAFMEGTASPYALCFAFFQSPSISVVSSRYYDGQNAAPVFVAEYNTDNPAPTPLTALGTAYGDDPADGYLPLEVCAMIESFVGLGSTSKPVYNRKFLRGVPTSALSGGTDTDSPTINVNATGSTAAAKLGNGSLYGGRVYISPDARSANNWVMLSEAGNHQIPRGRKRSSSKATSSALSEAEQLLKLALASAL